MTAAHVTYQEGDLFAVPLEGGAYAAGLAARTSPQGVVLGYFFGRRFGQPPETEEFRTIKADDAITVKTFGDLGLLRGDWPVIGRIPDWRREHWPMPAFGRTEPLTGRLLRVDYDDDNPNSRPREIEVSSVEFEDLPEDGLAGFEFVQQRLSRLLDQTGP